MTRNIRISLTILSIGFAIEGTGEVYTRYVSGPSAPGANVLYLLPLALTAVGLLFVWIGRHEWNELHLARVRSANRIFASSLLGGVVAAVVLALLVWIPSLGTPVWATVLFGAAVGSLVFGTFVTYATLVFHLVSNPGRAAVAIALVWALAVSVAVAIAIAGALPTIVSIIGARNFSVPAFVAPVEFLVSYLFISYYLLLVAYVDAHVVVGRGPSVVAKPLSIPR
ncbi:MAG TPA: hypothetical protein VN842_05625 [Thermoplasmata archaeon]|nr:hypothetical protein [Thermoplasmata archaeon]